MSNILVTGATGFVGQAVLWGREFQIYLTFNMFGLYFQTVLCIVL